MLAAAGVLGIVGAVPGWRSNAAGLNVSGDEAFYTFHSTRDTFSPWGESGAAVAKLPQYRFSGAGPIVRDFYVFIPTVMAGDEQYCAELCELLHREVLNKYSWPRRYRQRLSDRWWSWAGRCLFRRRDRRRADYQMVRLAVANW